MMSLNLSRPDGFLDDTLRQFVRSAHGRQAKLDKISSNQQHVAISHGRAAAALHSLVARSQSQKRS